MTDGEPEWTSGHPLRPSSGHRSGPRWALFAAGAIAGVLLATLFFWTPLPLLPAAALAVGAWVAPGRTRRAALAGGGVLGACLPWTMLLIPWNGMS